MKIRPEYVFVGVFLLIVSNAFAHPQLELQATVTVTNNTPWQILVQPLNCNHQGGRCNSQPMVPLFAHEKSKVLACNFNFLKLTATNPAMNTPWPSTPLIPYNHSIQCAPFSINWQCYSGAGHFSEHGNCLVIGP